LTRRERWLRLLKRIGLGLGIFVLVLVLAVVLLTQTGPGRAFIVRVALPYVDAAIPGRIELRELARLAPSGVELRGVRVFDPRGDEVLRLELLRVEISLGELVDGRIVIPEVELRQAAVDLRTIAEKRRGLVAAFVDPDAPKSPPSSEPPPYVRVERLAVSALDVRAPLAGPLGELDARGIALEASYELDRTSAATLRRFSARVERNGKKLIGIAELGAKLQRNRTPSEAKLKLTLGADAELELRAKLVAPPEPSWKKEPASVTLEVKRMTATVLAELLQNPELEKAFLGALSTNVTLSGTPERLSTDLSLETEGGKLALTANVEDFERVRATLDCKDFSLAGLRSDLPARRVTLSLTATTDVKNPEKMPITVEIKNSRIDDTALPALTLASSITPKAAEGIDLSAVDGESRLGVHGKAGFDGAVDAKISLFVGRAAIEKWSRFAGQESAATGEVRANLDVKMDRERRLDVTGKVSIERLKAPEVEVERADASLELHGDLERPVVDLDLRVGRAIVAKRPVSKLALRVKGGPSRYRLGLDADLVEATVALDATVERGARHIGLEAEGHGTLQKHPWKVAIAPTTVTFAGDVDTKGVELELSGQELEAHGNFSKSGGTLEFQTGTIDLAKLSSLIALGEPLRGKVKLGGRLHGTPAAPNLDLNVTGEGLSLGERPPVDVSLTTAFNAEGGEAALKLALEAEQGARGKRPLALELDLLHKFRPGPGFARAIPDGTLLATLEIERVESEFVADWAKLGALPVKGALRGSVRAEGTQKEPGVQAELDADMLALGASLKPKLSFAYEKGDGRLDLVVDDERGRWLDVAATLGFGESPSLEALKERLPRAGSDAKWSLSLVAEERKLGELPGLREAKIPASAGLRLSVEHAPGAEPTGTFRATARPSRELDAAAQASCKPSRTRLELDGKLAAGRVQIELTALDQEKRLLETTADAEVALAPALAGGTPKLGKVHADVRAERLELATLPLVCGAARGTLSAQARVDDPLGSRPQVSAEIFARKFSLGGDETIDAELRAELSSNRAKADAALVSKEGRSTFKAELPVDIRDGRARVASDAPITLDVTLRRLPIAPFLNPRGAISYATGHLDGSVRARGRLSDPDLKGSIVLRDIAFTATDLAQPVHGVTGTLGFTRNELVIKKFEAHDRDGVIRIDGGAKFTDAEHVNVALDIKAEEFPIRQQGQVVATTELEAKVKAKLSPKRSEVAIDLGAVDMWIESLDTRSGIALATHPDFVIDGRAPPKKPEPEEAPAAGADPAGKGAPAPKKSAVPAARSKNAKTDPETSETLLTLDTNDRVWIKRDDFAVKLKAALKTRIEGESTRVEGRVSLLRGYLTLMGKDFEIQKGSSLLFIGSKKPNPVLDITAQHLNRRSGETIAVVITGRAEKPILTFKVDDKEVSAGQAFQAIYGSQGSNQDPNAADNQAKAFVGGLTAGLLATTARRELGAAAPIIMIEPGGDTSSGRVRAGFEFDSLVPSFLKEVVTGVYFEGIVGKEDTGGETQQSDARTQAGVLLEFYFPRNFFTSGQYGPGPTWSMDVGWQL
jgi:autotransporter translocation and assembly factor TamB